MKYREPPRMLYEEERGNDWTIFFVAIYTVLAIIILLNLWVAGNYFEVSVIHSSMEDTLLDGDIVYADKTASATYGDIIIIDVEPYRIRDGYSSGTSKGDYLIIKRLIGMEGDTVYGRDGVIYVKYAGSDRFVALSEDYTKGVENTHDELRDFGEVKVGAGEIYFLGDHRDVSKDSRAVGCYKYEDIIGVVLDWSVKEKGTKSQWEILARLIVFDKASLDRGMEAINSLIQKIKSIFE